MRRFLHTALVVLGLLVAFHAPPGRAQVGEDDSLSEPQRAAIQAAAQYLGGADDLCDELLQGLGFPLETLPGWDSFATQERLRIAGEAAERRNPGEGANRFLAALSRSLAQRYGGSLSAEDSLQPFLGRPSARVEFQLEVAGAAAIHLAADHSAAIAVAAQYIDHDSAFEILTRDFRLRTDAALRAMRRGTMSAVLAGALDAVATDARDGALRRLVETLDRRFGDTVRGEGAFAAFRRDARVEQPTAIRATGDLQWEGAPVEIQAGSSPVELPAGSLLVPLERGPQPLFITEAVSVPAGETRRVRGRCADFGGDEHVGGQAYRVGGGGSVTAAVSPARLIRELAKLRRTITLDQAQQAIQRAVWYEQNPERRAQHPEWREAVRLLEDSRILPAGSLH